jgi:hypothetical protein
MDINEKFVCQSCGMPMKVEEDFGTELNRDKNEEYCKFCYQNGEFTDKEITLKEKIDKLVNLSVNNLGMSEEQARKMAETKLPKLKRWEKTI